MDLMDYRRKIIANSPHLMSAEGAVVSFADGADLPLKSLNVDIEPVQSGAGDSSPDNVRPISGWNAVKVTRDGKNLLDDVTPTVVNAYISNLNGVPILRVNAENRTVIVQIKENTTYTYTWNQSAKAGASADDSNIILFDEYPVVGVTLGYSTGEKMNSTNNKRTFNSADYKYAAIKIANTSRSNFEETFSASMLEVGSTATAYEPYRGNTWFFGFNKLPPSVATTVTNNGITLTTNGDGTYTLTGQTGSSSAQVSAVLTEEYTFKSDDYIHVGNSVSNPSMSINFDKSSGGAATYYGPTPVNKIVKVAENVVGQTCGKIRFYIAANTTVNMAFKPMISTLGTAFDFVPYTGTVYGGTLNPLTGVLTAYPYYASYNGETLTGRWVSDRDKYVAGTTPTIGAQVVDMSGTGTEIQLTPQQIRSLYGQNNIFADTGNVAIEYWAHQ